MLETTPVLVDPADNAFDFHGAADPLAPNLLNHATSREIAPDDRLHYRSYVGEILAALGMTSTLPVHATRRSDS